MEGVWQIETRGVNKKVAPCHIIVADKAVAVWRVAYTRRWAAS
jgi:hypothetical protein